MNINEQEVVLLAPKIKQLTVDFDKFVTSNDKLSLQTLLKGSFSLLGVKAPKCALRISSCNIQIFFKLLDQVVSLYSSLSKTLGEE